ncbi:MAG: polysaccharide biosynthesis protein [Deltaproteobacteria bacterium]|nr:polysaccharide biosynthesis protein [Deltaproteobacteria bacterium]
MTVNHYLKDKRILVTGACGTVGSELFRVLCQFPEYGPKEIVGIDNSESCLFFMDQEYLNDDRTRFYLADVRDCTKISRIMKGIDIVFHAAALKHVVLCERSPFEAVQTNIHGVQNIIMAATENHVSKVIFTSSDKAVNPTNVMGTSKLMGERLITAANSNNFSNNTIFASTRFGNVLGSSGSVIPIFQKQIEKGGPVTLTDSNMTRFVMSIEEAAKLVIDSASIARGGEVFITKMPVVRICDLAQVMINELAPKYGYKPDEIGIVEIGVKPGEKLYEELMSHEETRRAVELNHFFSVLPAFRGLYNDISYEYKKIVSMNVTNPYVSEDVPSLDMDSLRNFLKSNKLLDLDRFGENHPDERYWPGDRKEV